MIRGLEKLTTVAAAFFLAAEGCIETAGMPDPAGLDSRKPSLPPSQLPQGSTDKFALWSTGVNLRGANIYQRRVYPEIDGNTFIGPGPLGPPYAQSDFDALAAMGANYVNISHPGIFGEAPPYALDAAAQANLDDLIAKAAAAHLYVVIAFRTGPGRSEFAIHEGQTRFPQSLVNNRVWTEAAPQNAWVQMWRHAATRYRGNPAIVGFELMVEPNGPSVTHGIWDPAEFDARFAGSLADWNQLHPRLSAAIRSLDADTPILTSASQYGSIDWLMHLRPTADTRSVYTVHHYEPFAYSHQEAGERIAYPGRMSVDGVKINVNAAWLSNRLAAIDTFRAAHAVPVAITEFGVKRWAPGAGRYLADQIAAMESRGVNHALWIWESSYAGVAQADDFNFRHGANAGVHVDQAGSELITAIRQAWSANQVRP